MNQELIREYTKNFMAIMIVFTLCLIVILSGKLLEVFGTAVGMACAFYFNTRGKIKEDNQTSQDTSNVVKDTNGQV